MEGQKVQNAQKVQKRQKTKAKSENSTLSRPIIKKVQIKDQGKMLKDKLKSLQKVLKQQSLLAQKQQQQKKRLKQSIQQSINKYYSIYASSCNQGKLTTDQGLGNCYNFVKQICLEISRDTQIAVLLLTQTELIKIQQMLPIIVNLIYQSIAQSDFYKKPVVKMLKKLIRKVVQRIHINKDQQIRTSMPKDANINESAIFEFQQPPIQLQTHSFSQDMSQKSKQIGGSSKGMQSKQQNIAFLKKIIKIFLNRLKIQQYFNTVAGKTITNVLKLNLRRQVFCSHRKAFANSFINFEQQKSRNSSKKQRQSMISEQDNMSLGSMISNSFSNEDYQTFSYTEDYAEEVEQEKTVDKQIHQVNKAKDKPTKSKNEDKTAFTLAEFKMVVFQNYQREILVQASFAPTELKILIKLLFDNLKELHFHESELNSSLWQFLQDSYLQPFQIMGKNLQEKLFDIPKREILSQIQEKLKQHAKVSSTFLQSLISKLTTVDQEKYRKFVIEQISGFKSMNKRKKSNNQPNLMKQPKQAQPQDYHNDLSHVIMNSICLNYREIFLIFSVIKSRQSIFKERQKTKLLNRLNKLYEMSENLQILRKNDKEKKISTTNTYLLFTQLNFSELLMMDYLKQYVQQYKGSMIKNILRQVLVQLDQFSDQAGITLVGQQNQNSSNICQQNLSGILADKMKQLQRISTGKGNISLFTKIKYLIFKINESSSTNEEIILVEAMLNQAVERMNYYVEIYEKSKFHLLRTYSSIKSKNMSVRSTRKTEKNLNLYLKNIQMISKAQLSLCVTSPSSRNNLFANQNIVKYHISAASKLMIQNPQNCVHKENIILGMPFHINNLSQFLLLFSKFREVKTAIETNHDNSGIKTTLYLFIDQLKKKIILQNKLGQTEVAQLTKTLSQVVMKILHSYLLQKSFPNKLDDSFQKKLLSLSFIRAKNLNVPIENNLQQFWEICSQYFSNLSSHKTPQSKIQSLKQVHQITKVVLFHNKNPQRENQYIETMLIYVLIRAKPKRFISNLNFIQLFLPQSKLLASQGYILNIYKKIVQRIKLQDFDQSFHLKKEQIAARSHQMRSKQELKDKKFGRTDA